jgi:hypothetical protein
VLDAGQFTQKLPDAHVLQVPGKRAPNKAIPRYCRTAACRYTAVPPNTRNNNTKSQLNAR